MADLPPLTSKQQQFVDHYIANGFNASKAAAEAGYSAPEPRGSENVRKSNIRAHLDAHFAEMAMSSDEVLARIAAHAKDTDKQVSLRALDMLGKARGLFLQRHEIQHNWQAEIEEMGLSPGEVFDELVGLLTLKMEGVENGS